MMDDPNLSKIALPLKFYLAKLIIQNPKEVRDDEAEYESVYTMGNNYYNTSDYMLFGNFRPISKFPGNKEKK